MALLFVAFCLAACGSETKEDNAHDSKLTGYWISDKRIALSSDGEKEETDESGVQGIEFYENGMVRIMQRQTDLGSGHYYYSVDETYSDYMCIGENQIALMSENSNGEKIIRIIFEYVVKDGVLTMVRYAPDMEYAITYKALNTPFHKYFPEVNADDTQGNLIEGVVDDMESDEG